MKYLSGLFLIFSIQAYTHEIVEPYNCTPPSSTGKKITSEMEKEFLHSVLLIYESCMFGYIREQQRLADVHEVAAEDAMKEWNNYLNIRLP
jgi:hypothetical protein